MSYPRPKRIKRVSPKRTDVYWDDDHISRFPSWYLREKCPCADCVDEFTGERRIVHGSIPSSLERTGIELVGNYAVQFTWSDNHNTGLYPFDLLRELCPCSECLPEGLEEPPETVLPPGSFEV